MSSVTEKDFVQPAPHKMLTCDLISTYSDISKHINLENYTVFFNYKKTICKMVSDILIRFTLVSNVMPDYTYVASFG